MTSVPARQPHALVIAYDFPPHAAIGTMRTLRVVRQLSTSGWKVTVLTSDPCHFLAGTPVDETLLAHVPPDVVVLRAGPIRLWDVATAKMKRAVRVSSANGNDAPQNSSHNPRPRSRPVQMLAAVKHVIDAALSIPDRMSGWILPAVWTGLKHHMRSGAPDIVYSSAPPWTGQLVALWLQAALRRPWVADFRDPWSRAPWREDRFRFAMRAAAWLERGVVKAADRIVFVAEGNREDFSAHYGADVASKFQHVPNGCDPGEFERIAETVSPQRDPHVMLHAGSLYAGRSPILVLQALAAAIAAGRLDPSRFKLRFLGWTDGVAGLPEACVKLGLTNVVEFAPRVPRRKSLQEMLGASSLLLLQPGHMVSVPGKLYEYLAAGRPILALAEEGETAHVVRRSGIGVSVTGESEVDLIDALLSVIGMSQTELPAVPRELYDGFLGAAEIERLLRTTIAETADLPLIAGDL